MSTEKNIDLLRRDECQPMTTAQMESAKAQIRPRNRANVNIVPYHIYDEDEHIVGEWRQTVDGVKKKKPVYEKRIDGLSIKTTWNSQYNAIKDIAAPIQNVDFIVSSSAKGINYSDTSKPVSVGCFDIVIKSSSTWKVVNQETDYTITSIIVRYTKTTDEWEEADE